jgi:glyceraldehyde 3-phosphate dehydrogenase
MSTRIGINGIGRIGRNLWRIIRTAAPDLSVVAANDTADIDTIAHLLRYDTIRGRFTGTVEVVREALVLDGVPVPVHHEPTPDRINWASHGVDLVIEATGAFTRGPAARGHLRGGAPAVVVSTAAPDADVCLMMGINEHAFDPARHRVISNACCSTYCIAAMVSPLNQAYGIRNGSVTLAYSHGSRPGPLLDDATPQPGQGHPVNLRMARANAVTLVPANVPGVRHALDQVLPGLAGRIAATAFRLPVRATSMAVLTLRLARPASADEVNDTLQAAATTLLKGYLEVSEAPLVSSDVIGSAASCVVDPDFTTATGDLVRVVGWYDNEWGYAHRLVDLARVLTARANSASGYAGSTGPAGASPAGRAAVPGPG